MNILVLGGSGNISYPFCVDAISNNWNVTTVTRGLNDARRRTLEGSRIRSVYGDLKDTEFLHSLSNSIQHFDAVINFVSYDGADANNFIRCFAGKTSHYIFVSTTAGYSKVPDNLPYNETTPFDSLDWSYSRRKREAELAYFQAYEDLGFPITVARFGHTYDTVVPVAVGPADWTIPHRILNGKPVLLHGDGTSIWSLMHSSDAAKALTGLCCNDQALGEIVNIVSNHRITWIDLTKLLFKKLNTDPLLSFAPSQVINQVCPYLGDGILGHKMWNEIYTNNKLQTLLPNWKQTISIEDGLKLTLDWYQQDKSRRTINSLLDNVLTKLCECCKP